MPRSDSRGPTGRHEPRAPRSVSPIRYIAATAVLALTGALVLVPAVGADPEPSEDELRAKIEKLTTRAEVVTEKYNGQKLELAQARKDAAQARQRAARLDRQLQQSRADVRELAASQYKTGGAGKPAALFGTDNPGRLMDNATMLSHLARQKVDRLREMRTLAARAEHAEQRKHKAVAEAERLTAELERKKERIQKLVREAEQRLAELQPPGPAPVNVGNLGSRTAAEAAEVALAQQGTPYVWGAAGPDSFDCSGLVTYAFKQQGIQLPHYTGKLWNSGTHVSRSELRPGDLVFTEPHHVGIYVGGGRMVHAPHSGTVVQVDEFDDYYGGVRIT